jgi:sulfite reductase (NADPH) hemoprotein beta-component
VYQAQRTPGETFISTLRRVGFDTFKTAANSARHSALAHA